MAWLTMNAVPLLNIVGIVFDIVGAFFIASEVVRQFRGQKYKGSAGWTFDSSVTMTPPATETEEYKAWDRRKYRRMKIGLALLVLGFGLQIVANLLQIRNDAAIADARPYSQAEAREALTRLRDTFPPTF
jgi:hypothetical protein